MLIKNLIDEDFVNYKKPSMFTKQQYGPVTTHQDGLPVGTKL